MTFFVIEKLYLFVGCLNLFIHQDKDMYIIKFFENSTIYMKDIVIHLIKDKLIDCPSKYNSLQVQNKLLPHLCNFVFWLI